MILYKSSTSMPHHKTITSFLQGDMYHFGFGVHSNSLPLNNHYLLASHNGYNHAKYRIGIYSHTLTLTRWNSTTNNELQPSAKYPTSQHKHTITLTLILPDIYTLGEFLNRLPHRVTKNKSVARYWVSPLWRIHVHHLLQDSVTTNGEW